MNKRRLLKLADLLEADAKNKKGIKFDLGTWGYTEASNPFADDAPDPAVSCGTTACAMGLAAISGAFKRQGLKATISQRPTGKYIAVRLGRREGLSAATKLFGITMRVSEWLFLESGYRTDINGAKGERVVANRIRDFVAGKDHPQVGG